MAWVFTANVPTGERVTAGGETPPEPIPILTLRGGDAADIVPEDLLRTVVADHSDGDGNVAEEVRTVRGKFAALQRVLETRIARYDAELDVVFEDTELIVYRLDDERDFDNIFDFCEIDSSRTRRLVVELMRAIATGRTASVTEFPLVVRKPRAFRVGEQHAHNRVARSGRND